MKLRVELQTYLEQYSPDGANVFDYELPDGSTAGELMRKLLIPADLAAVIIVNGANTDASQPLKDGDTIVVIPPLAGG
jgi:molybdopterin converting factor small subunit